MLRSLVPKTAFIALVTTLGAPAQASIDLARKHSCASCHAPDRKLVGPSYKDIAARYRGQADAGLKLADKVRNGGSGVWGRMVMPPMSKVPDADLKALVEWILATR